MSEFWHGLGNIAVVSALIWFVFVYLFGLHILGFSLIAILFLGYFLSAAREAAERHAYKRKPQ